MWQQQNNMLAKSHFLSSRVIYSVMFYTLLISIIFISKPATAFDPQGVIKPFGIGQGKTVFSFGTIVTTLAIVVFYVFCLIDILVK